MSLSSFSQNGRTIRFINVNGHPGQNITCDFHMVENMNKVIKSYVHNMRANQSEKAIKKIGKCIGYLSLIWDRYYEYNSIPKCGCHHAPSDEKNLKAIIEELQKAKVFMADRVIPMIAFSLV